MSRLRLKQLAQDSATAGQAVVWNGTAWAPGAAGASNPPHVFDVNAAPYSAVANLSSSDQAAAWTSCITDAINYAKGSTGNGVAIIEADLGEYYLTGSLATTGGAYALITIPKVASTDPYVTLVIRPKGGGVYNPSNVVTRNKGAVTFRSTLTGATYSSTLGWPAMLGAPNEKSGTPGALASQSWMHLVLDSVGFRQPANPSLAGADTSMMDRVTFKNCRWDTLDAFNSSTFRYPTQPTHPTAVANVPAANNNDGFFYEGQNECEGYYGGFGIGELCNVAGTLYVLECYVGLNLHTPWYHIADIGHSIITRCPYGMASVDPSSGVAYPTGIANTGHSHLRGVMDMEHTSSGWQALLADVYDPNSVLAGRVETLVTTSGVGNTSNNLTTIGAANLNMYNLATGATSVGSTVVNRMRLNQATFDTSPIAATDWIANGSTIAQTTAQQKDGAGAMRVTCNGAAQAGANTVLSGGSGALPVTGSTQYTALASFRPNSTVRNVEINLAWFNGTTFLSSSVGSAVSEVSGAWVQAVCTATAPATATNVGVYVLVDGTPPSGEIHDVDDAGLFVGTVTTWVSP